LKVLYKWDKCSRFKHHSDAYYLEIHKSEISDKILSFLGNEVILLNEEYFQNVNCFANDNIKYRWVNENCIYLLIDKDVTTAILCPPIYPYSSQWNGYCPFHNLYEPELLHKDHLNNFIEITKLDDLKRIDEIILSKNYKPI